MKMDQQAFRTAVPLTDLAIPRRPASLGAVRAAFGAAFLLLAPLVLLPYWAALAFGMTLAAAVRLVRDCVAYATEVTVGRP